MDFALNQTATYWAFSSANEYGDASFDAPVTVSCRWENIEEVIIDYNGDEVTSQGKIYLGQDVDVRGFMYLGTSAADSPYSVRDAREIVAFRKVPDLANTEYLRIARV